MASPEKIAQAINITRSNQLDIGMPHSRIHKEAAHIRTAVLRALEHPCCTQCNHLKIEFRNQSNREIALLHCDARHSPVALWQDLWLTKTATCPDCTDPAGRPEEEALRGWIRD